MMETEGRAKVGWLILYQNLSWKEQIPMV